MLTDPIADMLTRIRNAVRARHAAVDMPTSKVKRGVADVLKREGYIWDWEELDMEVQQGSRTKKLPYKVLRIHLKYGPNGEQVIRHIRRISKPGRRIYSKVQDLRPVLNGLGIAVLSTNRGVLSDREARTQKVGGEVLCEVW